MAGAVFIRGKVTGYEQAYQSIRNVADPKKRQNIMRGAVRAAARLVEKAVKPEIPERHVDPKRQSSRLRHVPGFTPLEPGALRSSLKTRIKVRRGGEVAKTFDAFGVSGYVIVGDRKRGIYWAHFVEKGTRPHSLAKGARMARKGRGGADRGQSGHGHPGTKAVKYMETAVKNTETERGRLFSEYVEKRLAALARSGQG